MILRKLLVLVPLLGLAAMGEGQAPVPKDKPAPGAEQIRDLDEEILRAAGVATDTASLIAFLEKRSPVHVDPHNLEPLVRQLGSDDFKKREKTIEDFKAVGLIALPALRRAVGSSDADLASRAKALVEELSASEDWAVRYSVVRLAIKRSGTRAILMLIRYLPFESAADTIQEIFHAIDGFVKRDGEVRALIALAIKDSSPVRRGLAGLTLARRGELRYRETVMTLLQDPDETVRLRTAQGLLGARDVRAIPTLIALLNASHVGVAWEAEELLRYAAGETAPLERVRTRSSPTAVASQAEWQAWWKKRGKDVDLAHSARVGGVPRLLLVSDYDLAHKGQGRVWLCGHDGKPRWQVAFPFRCADARLLAEGRLLVLEPSSRQIAERNLNGQLHWKCPTKWVPDVCLRLPNGRTFSSETGAVVEYTESGQELRRFIPLEGPVLRAQRGPNGLLYCLTRSSDMGSEITVANNKTFRPIAVLRSQQEILSHHSFELLRNGLAIVGQDSGLVLWHSPSVRSRISLESDFRISHAIQSPSGTFLVCGTLRDSIGAITELDANGNIRWECVVDGQPQRIRDCFPLLWLGFGNELASANPDSTHSRLRQLTHGSPLVRRRALLALLGKHDDFRPHSRLLLDTLTDKDDEVRTLAKEFLVKHGTSLIEDLALALNDNRATLRAGVANVAGELNLAELNPSKRAKLVAALVERTKDENSEVRRAAAASLGTYACMDAASVCRPLIGSLADTRWEVREAAAQSLRRCQGRAGEVVPALRAIVGQEQVARVTQAAAMSIGAFGSEGKDAVVDLVALLDAKDNDSRFAALHALERIGKEAQPAIPRLVKALKDEEFRPYWMLVVHCLRAIGPPSISEVSHLRRILREKDADHQVAAAAVLGLLGRDGTDAVDDLARFLKEGDDRLALAAARALGEIGPSASQTVPLLVEFAEARKDKQSLIVCLDALANIGPAAAGAIPFLRKLRESDAIREPENDEVRFAIIRALGRIERK